MDLSGNPVLEDIGNWLHDQLVSTFVDADVKYIAPSYMIRSTTTTATDRVYCKVSPSPSPLLLNLLTQMRIDAGPVLQFTS